MHEKCFRNPTKPNLTLPDNVSPDLNESVELDKVCFLNGHLTNAISDSFNGTNFPHTMSYKFEQLGKRISAMLSILPLLKISMMYSI